MRVFKLEQRKIVVSENGVSKVLHLPCGVSYSEDAERFYCSIINDVTNGWKTRSWGIKKHGAIEAFEMAVEAREDSLDFLLTRRLLPRIRKAYEIREIDKKFIVRDPLAKIYRKFATLRAAFDFNESITREWIAEYAFDKRNMITIQNAIVTHGSDYTPRHKLHSSTGQYGLH